MTDFDRNTESDQGEQYVNHHEKAPSAGSSTRQGSRLGRIVRGAFAKRGFSGDARGSGAPKAKLLLTAFAALATTLVLGVALAAATAPVVTVEDANEVRNTTTLAKGTVNPEGKETNCHFEYVTQGQFEANVNSAQPEFQDAGQTSCEGGTLNGNSAQPVQAKLEGLVPKTTYHLRLVASNGDGPSAAVATNTFKTLEVAKPLAKINPVTAITATGAHFSGEVNPNAPGDSETEAQDPGYDTQWVFDCVPGCGSPGGPQVAGDNDFHVVEVNAGLEPNTTYTVTLHAKNAGGENEVPAETTFKTLAIPATVSNPQPTSVNDLKATSARLTALVSVHNSPLTECRFEWGLTSAYGNTEPCEGEPEGPVGAPISGLTPETTYHFRIIAANGAGAPAEGEDQEFTTLSEAPTPPCANAAIRAEQRATLLPECRAWEVVSPADKNGADITGEGETVIALSNDDVVSYSSRGGFAGTQGSANIGLTRYLARRTADGWSNLSVIPTPALNASQVFIGSTQVSLFSEDMGKAIVSALDLAAQSDDIPNGLNFYLEDTETKALRTITTFPSFHNLFESFSFLTFRGGASGDAEQLAFGSRTSLLPEAAQGFPNVYEWDHGTLRLAGILPDGSVPPEGSRLPLEAYRPMVSRDGSRLLFMTPGEGDYFEHPGQLYLRRNHSSTAWVSEPEGSTPVPSPEGVKLQWASPDGKHILFTTTSKLLDEDGNEEGPDLYLYSDGPNPASEDNLTMISADGHIQRYANESIVIGAADDASRIYFQEGDGSYYWEDGDLRPLPFSLSYGGQYSMAVTAATRSIARVSADGRRLAFLGQGSLTGQPTSGYAMYLYDGISGRLVCASCPPGGQPATSNAQVEPNPDSQVAITQTTSYLRSNFLSADGGHVFFSSADALVPEDTNEVTDTYSYDADTGEVSLLSSGQGEQGTWFNNASSSGHDVFMTTRGHLVGADSDELIDLYDARVGGGFVEPPPPPTPCSGDGCREALSSPPVGASPSTKSFSGPGNQRVKRHHHKRRRRHAKHHAAKRAAGAERGGSK